MDCQREAKPLEFTQGALAQLTAQAHNKRSLHGLHQVRLCHVRCYKSVPIGDELWMVGYK